MKLECFSFNSRKIELEHWAECLPKESVDSGRREHDYNAKRTGCVFAAQGEGQPRRPAEESNRFLFHRGIWSTFLHILNGERGLRPTFTENAYKIKRKKKRRDSKSPHLNSLTPRSRVAHFISFSTHSLFVRVRKKICLPGSSCDLWPCGQGQREALLKSCLQTAFVRTVWLLLRHNSVNCLLFKCTMQRSFAFGCLTI